MISFSLWNRCRLVVPVFGLAIAVGCLGPKVDDDAFGRWPDERVGAGGGGGRDGGRIAPPPRFDGDRFPDGGGGGGVVTDTVPRGGWIDLKDPAGSELDEFTELRDASRWPPVYFAYNQSRIGETERPKLSVVAAYLQQNPGFQLLVEGHCDERGSDEYNRALGERRALAVREYLEGLGIDVNRIRTLSYGEERPAVPGQTEQDLALNRRGEFVMLLPRR